MMKESFLLWNAMEKALAKNEKVNVVFRRSNEGMSTVAIRVIERINKEIFK